MTKKFFALFIFFCVVVLSSVSYADVIDVGDNHIEYDSLDQLQEVYAALLGRIGSQFKTVLFDADTYESATFIIGETFPSGRYYVYPVIVSDKDTDEYPEVLMWDKDKIDEKYSTDYVCAQWCRTIELTDGMKIKLHWDVNQRGVNIAMHKLPEDNFNLMEAFD